MFASVKSWRGCCCALALSVLAWTPVEASPVGFQFSTTLDLTPASGPSSANVVFRMQYDPTLPGDVESGGGNTNAYFTDGVSGTVHIDGVEVGTLWSEISLSETITSDSVTLLWSLEPTLGAFNAHTDNLAWTWDVQAIRLSWGGDSSMLATAQSLPSTLETFDGNSYVVNIDVHGNNASGFGGEYGVKTISGPSGDTLQWQQYALVPEPAGVGLMLGGVLLLGRRSRKGTC